MANSIYQKLIDDICAMADLPTAGMMYQNADLTIDQVDFTLRDATVAQEDALVMYCDFGLLPSSSREQVLERLLQVNLAMHGPNAPVFAQNPQNGHIILARRIPLAGMRALDVMNVLAEHATHVKQWREGYYLRDDKGLARTGKSRSHLLLAGAGGLQRA